MKIINCYAGVGGNRMKWGGGNISVTAVEKDERIAEVYQKLYPNDKVIVADAHKYLLENYSDFDFAWSSPPCPTHSRMIISGRNHTPRYPDMKLYQEILFLKHFFKGKWVVENVIPYYDPLIPAEKIGRHLLWANFKIGQFHVPEFKGFIKKQNLESKKQLQEWLGIHFDETIYIGDNHCPTQVLRNCVHPDLGLHIFNRALGIHESKTEQGLLF